jgi:hypothetical protein
MQITRFKDSAETEISTGFAILPAQVPRPRATCCSRHAPTPCVQIHCKYLTFIRVSPPPPFLLWQCSRYWAVIDWINKKKICCVGIHFISGFLTSKCYITDQSPVLCFHRKLKIIIIVIIFGSLFLLNYADMPNPVGFRFLRSFHHGILLNFISFTVHSAAFRHSFHEFHCDHEDPLLGNDREISRYRRAVAR